MLDPLIHQPIRTKIIAILIRDGEADYNSIKTEAQITDGHMSTHIRALSEAHYIEVKKEFIGNKPRTSYRLSKKGKKQFENYINQLKQLIVF